MTETEQRYHSNKQEFLALKWAVTSSFMSICLHMGRIGKSLLSGRTTIHSPTSSPQPIWMPPDRDG